VPGEIAPSSIVHALLYEAESREASIARELHDGVGSSLAGVAMLLGTAQSFTREPEALALIHKAQEQVAALTQQVRQMSRGMMPAGQERGALLPALEHFAAGIDGLQGMRCTVRSRGDFGDIPPATGRHLFRTVQEAVSNALRHGAARHVRITLARAGDRCRMTVADDGTGCSPGRLFAADSGIGIQSMRARAGEIAGHLEIRVRPRGGVQVRVTWPASARPFAARGPEGAQQRPPSPA
jgi:signal transduction histidine kinase